MTRRAVVAAADRRVAPGELRVVGEPLEPGSGAADQQLVADLKREPCGRAADRPQVGDGGRPRPTPVATSGVYHAAAPDEEPSKGPDVWISVIVPSWLTLYALISENSNPVGSLDEDVEVLAVVAERFVERQALSGRDDRVAVDRGELAVVLDAEAVDLERERARHEHVLLVVRDHVPAGAACVRRLGFDRRDVVAVTRHVVGRDRAQQHVREMLVRDDHLVALRERDPERSLAGRSDARPPVLQHRCG